METLLKMGTGFIVLAVLVVLGIVGVLVWFGYMKIKYKTVPSNEALIVTGHNIGDSDKDPGVYQDSEGRHMKVVRGGGHRLKLFQHHVFVSLSSFQTNLSTTKVPTINGVQVTAEAVATVKVSDSLGGIVKYSEQFLGKKQKDIVKEISQVLESNFRAIVSKMTVESINGDRESFNEEVRNIAQDQLDRMGFQITSFGLTDLTDEEGYIENLGRPQIAEIKKEAEIAESTNERATKVHVARMNEEIKKEEYEREISIAEARKDKEIKDAKILAETEKEKAKTEASYSLEKAERELEVERERLKIIRQDKEEELRILQLAREQEVKLEQEEVKVRKAKADADYYEKVRFSEATAEAELKAGKSKAEVIRLTSGADIEAIEKRAEALEKNKEVMLTEMVINMLPKYAKAIAEPLGNVESIRILDNGEGKAVNNLPGSVTDIMAKAQESLLQMTGIDIKEVLDNASGKSNLKGELGTIARSLENKESVHVLGDITENKVENEIENEEEEADRDKGVEEDKGS